MRVHSLQHTFSGVCFGVGSESGLLFLGSVCSRGAWDMVFKARTHLCCGLLEEGYTVWFSSTVIVVCSFLGCCPAFWRPSITFILEYQASWP